jgi:hypothetical protein
MEDRTPDGLDPWVLRRMEICLIGNLLMETYLKDMSQMKALRMVKARANGDGLAKRKRHPRD